MGHYEWGGENSHCLNGLQVDHPPGVWAIIGFLLTQGDHRFILPPLHRHILNGGVGAIQIHVPAEVGLAIGDDLCDKFADQVGTGFRLGEVQDLLQGILNPAPFGLIQGGHIGVGQGFVFCRQALELGVQLLPLGEKFLLGDLTVGAHIQEGFLLALDALHPGGDVGEAGFGGSLAMVALADQATGVADQIPLLPEDLFQDLLPHQFQLPVGDHRLVTVAGVIRPGFPALLSGAVVEDVVALVAVAPGGILVLVPAVLAEGTAAGTLHLASPQLVILLCTMDRYLCIGLEALLHPTFLDGLNPVPLLLGDNGREISFDAQIRGFIKIVDPFLF